MVTFGTAMFEIILYQPEIPPNTGNIIRLCAVTGNRLHLIRPLGFQLSDKQLKRAGLDYHHWTDIACHNDLQSCLTTTIKKKVFCLTTKGSTCYTTPNFEPGDAFLFGPETRGLPVEVLNQFPQSQWLRLPQQPHARSLNLANCVSVMIYEAWRQNGFALET